MCAIIIVRLEKGGDIIMMAKKFSKNRLKNAVFGSFFAIVMLISSVGGLFVSQPVVAEPVGQETETVEIVEVVEETRTENGADTETTTQSVEATEEASTDATIRQAETTEEVVKAENENQEKVEATAENENTEKTLTTDKDAQASCQDMMGGMGWLVCPATGLVSKAVDWLYGMIRQLLVINPIEAEDGQPVYEVWKYIRNLTNIVFIIFFLVIIYSQITGYGINNYGIKKALPKLVVTAILMNLSFIICSLLIDVSNVVGMGLRNMFESVEATVSTTAQVDINMADLYGALAGGIAIAGVSIMFDPGAIFMLVPILLGGLISVVSGLITISLRQAVVILLVMIAPLAMVANILPNTEALFVKWKNLLIKMLVFYPMFSLLFGAAHLAGWAIIIGAKDGFMLLLGAAVQIIPLFLSWSLMKMSGTALESVHSMVRRGFDRPIAASKGWAESRRANMNAKALNNPYSLPGKLNQFLSDRKIARDNETKEMMALANARGLAYGAKRNYKNGIPTKEGIEAYKRSEKNLRYQEIIERDKNNMKKGLGQLEAVKIKGTPEVKAKLDKLDAMMVDASDRLKIEQARGEMIDYKNAEGFHNRMDDAMNAHFDKENMFTIDENGNRVRNGKYVGHFDDVNKLNAALKRYDTTKEIMEGDLKDTQYAAAVASQTYDTQAKVIAGKFQKYADLTPASKDLEYRMLELSRMIKPNDSIFKVSDNMDVIVSGLRVINQRGDTDTVKSIMDDIMNPAYGGLTIGTHASQSLANFLMFEVKDNDPFIRRFGKYINLETASYYRNVRQKKTIDYDEYIRGYHYEPDGSIQYAKKDMMKLMEGTSLNDIERTALSSFDDSLKKAYGYDSDHPDKEWEVDEYLKKRKAIQTAFEPAFLSAGMKWMSGSEQINSGVLFWMGYNRVQRKDDNGDLVFDDNNKPVYDIKGVWEPDSNGNAPEGFYGFEDDVHDYYYDRAVAFVKDQTTGQILNMRTDYRDSVMEHMLYGWLYKSGDDTVTRERINEYNSRCNEIENKYAQMTPSKENMRKKEEEIRKVKMDLSGRQFREILGETGKLEQIFNTRGSGSAINAKDWLRSWVALDDLPTMQSTIRRYQKQSVKTPSQNAQNTAANVNISSIYDAATRQAFMNTIDNSWNNNNNPSVDEYYNEAMGYIDQWFGKNTLSIIKHDFKKYYDRNKNSSNFTAQQLKDKLQSLLSDPNNYPGA